MAKYPHILYKSPISMDTLYIVQYLHFCGINAQPVSIFERNHPTNITELPTIYDIQIKKMYSGISEVILFYETLSKIDNLDAKAKDWKKENPDYTIHG